MVWRTSRRVSDVLQYSRYRGTKGVGHLAKSLNADLIAISTVGRSSIKGLLFFNIAERVLSTCDYSILTEKPEGFVSPNDPAFWKLHPMADQSIFIFHRHFIDSSEFMNYRELNDEIIARRSNRRTCKPRFRSGARRFCREFLAAA